MGRGGLEGWTTPFMGGVKGGARSSRGMKFEGGAYPFLHGKSTRGAALPSFHTASGRSNRLETLDLRLSEQSKLSVFLACRCWRYPGCDRGGHVDLWCGYHDGRREHRRIRSSGLALDCRRHCHPPRQAGVSKADVINSLIAAGEIRTRPGLYQPRRICRLRRSRSMI